jgi:hypothetical protein
MNQLGILLALSGTIIIIPFLRVSKNFKKYLIVISCLLFIFQYVTNEINSISLLTAILQFAYGLITLLALYVLLIISKFIDFKFTTWILLICILVNLFDSKELTELFLSVFFLSQTISFIKSL